MKKYLLWSAVILIVIFGNSYGARAQDEVTLLAPGSIKDTLEKLIPGFEAKTGRKVKATFSQGIRIQHQIASGEAFDVPVMQEPFPEVLASGNVVASSATPLANVALVVAVRQGAPKPDISTPEAVKQMLLAAKSISFPDPPGGSATGINFKETLKKLGIADEIQSKNKAATGGAGAMEAVAKGEVELGFAFLSEAKDSPGIDIVGPLPRAISTPTSLVGFVSTHAKDPAGAKALLDYLSSPDAAPVYRAQGMQPGR